MHSLLKKKPADKPIFIFFIQVKNSANDMQSRYTGREGFEPSQTEPESVVLPLHYRPN